MTIEIDQIYAKDLLVDNEVLKLGRGSSGREWNRGLAAIFWLQEGRSPLKAHSTVLEYAVNIIRTRFTKGLFWLLASHSDWQLDNRVVRYRKLWKSLASRGLMVPVGRDLAEGCIAGPSGIRYFGARELPLTFSFENVAAALGDERDSYVAVLRNEFEGNVAELVRTGWNTDHAEMPATDVLDVVSSAGGIVLWPLGEFDDREAGIVAIGQPGVVDMLRD